MHVDAFAQIAAILLAAALLGALGVALRQPLIVSVIGVGILVGPSGLGLVPSEEQLALLAHVGIALLLFVVGLKLDLHTIRTVGPIAATAGILQVVVTAAAALALALALGFSTTAAAYLAIALTFSSTIIVVKLLSDRREIDALHGRIAVGILIVQDLVVVVVMIALTALGAAGETTAGIGAEVVLVALKGVLLVGGIGVVMRWGLTAVTARLARVPELLVLAAIAWAVGLSALSDWLGFGKEVGAFLGGVAIASTPYREAIASRLSSLRDFLLLFFFIDLGIAFDVDLLGEAVGAALALSAFVLFAKPLIVMALVGAAGYRRRTAFFSGLALGQISEFSLIVGALGRSLGHLDEATMALITTVGLVTFALSTYPIVYANRLYERLRGVLRILERRHPYRESAADSPDAHGDVDVVLFGLGRYGGSIAEHLRGRSRRVLGVDFDPQALAAWRDAGLPVVYGDVEDSELYDHLPLGAASWVVNTAPDPDGSRVMIGHLRARGFAGRIAVAARTEQDEEAAGLQDADVVLRPFADAAEQAVDVLTSALDRLSAVAARTPGLREVRVPPGSTFEGSTIERARLRERHGVTVLAVSRAGRAFVNPEPRLQLFPGDRVIMSGHPQSLARAAADLTRIDFGQADGLDEFHVEEVPLSDAPHDLMGQTLAALDLRNRMGVTVIAFRLPDGRVESATPGATLARDMRLIVAGARAEIEELERLFGATRDAATPAAAR